LRSAPATVIVPMPASEGERIVTVLLESNGTQPSGLGGIVFVEE
jgi:beta-galactosidase